MTYIYSAYCPRCKTWLDSRLPWMAKTSVLFQCGCGAEFRIHHKWCSERVTGVKSGVYDN